MWTNLGSLFLGNYNYHTFPSYINSSQIKFEFDESSLPADYLSHCQDLIIIAREFSDNSTEKCGIIRPQNSSMIFQLDQIPDGYTDFKIKIKKIPRYRYGLGINTNILYWG